ncbi:MAG: DUF853 family protein [Lachnospiraceae bacterium]|nr:DUF853 family protein [Lachnospiraceae bacterium]MBQ2101087.1 DUF853 family protein [Lachnospiraceae bacterium]MBQ3907116.1 DUF853 family protein [Lachnospiraceae bacterium]
MFSEGKIYMGLANGERVYLPLNMCNRHGLIAGASGTGKTITMKVMAESFADAGVPVFLCDIKGDVSGLATAGAQNEGMEKRIDKFGIRGQFQYKPYSTTFWDIYGENGHPIRVTISDMGPDLLSQLLGLTEAQQGVLNIAFRIADDKGLLLIDLKDLKALLNYLSEHRDEFLNTYGNISAQSVGGILRAILPLESQGGDLFFGEPDLDIFDWIRTDMYGKGMINLLDCVKLVHNPKLYACFMLWLMAELFERLPEAGDADKPKLVFFFDEAHMLFADAPKVLVQKIEQLVKLIRSKGVGIYFVTQSPSDIPDSVLAQLSNRVQHALRAYTPAEQKAVRAAASSFRANPEFKTEDVIMELGVGEALTSFLDDKGIPQIVQYTKIICPQSLMAPCEDATRRMMMRADGMNKYDTMVDNESAYELLAKQREKAEEEAKLEAERAQLQKEREEWEKQKAKEEEEARKKREKEEEAERKRKEKEEAEAKKKKEKAEEAAKKKKDAAAERRKAKIETQLISTGGQILRRGLLNTLFKK